MFTRLPGNRSFLVFRDHFADGFAGLVILLLLDDVLSELDATRQRYLIETMKDVQIFVSATGIEEELQNMLPKGNVYYVDNGKVNLYNR